MRMFTGGMIVVLAAVTRSAADISTREAKRIEEAATVLREIHAVPDKDIPLDPQLPLPISMKIGALH